MATVTKTILIDDVDGKPAHQSRTFVHEGKTYHIDLSALRAANFDRAVERFNRMMGEFAAVATEVTPEPTAKPKGKSRPTNSQAALIRQWARDNGYAVGERGRLRPEVTAAYQAAQV